MDYAKPIQVNFGYNLEYLWILIVGIIVGLVFALLYGARRPHCRTWQRQWVGSS
ncbi:MAG: hypothetical protein O7I93_01955 [Gemmatimonadetes bacterium]|nr:hypothetical protein [Gemmatimonadota bacterium]